MTVVETAASKLVELTFNRTADWIESKMTQAKTIKDVNQLNAFYQDMFNQLLQDKMDLITLAQQYQAELEEKKITDEDLENVRSTVTNVFGVITSYMEGEADKSDDNRRSLNNLKEVLPTLLQLVNVQTLQTMQILGFNYKEAVGKPLTLAIQQTIYNKMVTPASSETD